MILIDEYLLLLQRYGRYFLTFSYQVLQWLLKLQEVHPVGIVSFEEDEGHAVLLTYLALALMALGDIREVLLVIHEQGVASFCISDHAPFFFVS